MLENSFIERSDLRTALASCRRHFLVAAIFSVFVNILMLAGPLFMLQVYDRVLASRSEETLVVLLALVTGLFVVMGLLDYTRGRVLARAGARIQAQLDGRVMRAVLRRSIEPMERARSSSATDDVDALRHFLAGSAPAALFDLPWTPLFLAIIFLFHPLLGWVSAAGGLLLIILATANQLRSRRPAAEARLAAQEAGALSEALRQNADAVHALGMGRAAVSRWLKLRGLALAHQIAASDRMGSYTAGSKALRFYLQALVLAAGAWLVLRHEVSAGMMIAASILLGRALAPVEQAIAQWTIAQRALGGWRSLRDLLERFPPDDVRTAVPPPQGVVQVQSVSAVDVEGTPLLRNVNFRIEPGTALGVIGASGSGKTTLAKVLTGIWRPAAGKIRIDGASIDQWNPDEIGKYIGYLPQEIGLMSGTVAQNIARLDEARDDAAVIAAARLAGAHELLLSLPHGYDTEVGAGGLRLSGGQRQRVALARAFYRDPPVLVLDEPNANLDSEGEQALIETINQAKSRGRTVIVLAHRPGAIAACDMLLMLERGAQTDYGPRDDVLRRRARSHAQLVSVPINVAIAKAAAEASKGGAGKGA